VCTSIYQFSVVICSVVDLLVLLQISVKICQPKAENRL